MEKSAEDLEVDIRIADARAEVAIGLVRTMVRELAGIINWNEQDLLRSYWHSFDDQDPARDIVLLEIAGFGLDVDPDGTNPGGANGAYHRKREQLEHTIRKEIKQRRISAS